jgi:hypothetical protein
MPRLSEDERRRVVVRSDPYRFNCLGYLDVSGIEYVHRHPDDHVASMQLSAMPYDVVVHLLDYDDVPRKTADHPDFIITVGPAESRAPRQSIETFERPK